VTLCAVDISTGLNGQSLTIGLGTPDNLVLRNNAFPVIVAQDGVGVMAAAARVSDAGGKVVAFNKVWHTPYCWPLISLQQWTSQKGQSLILSPAAATRSPGEAGACPNITLGDTETQLLCNSK
jgi:hypothetical protein